MAVRRLAVLSLALTLLSMVTAEAATTDIQVGGAKFSLVDKRAINGSAKLKLSIKDEFEVIDKGSGENLDDISATLRFGYGNQTGALVVPVGAYDDTESGWRDNSSRSAKFQNKESETGSPTGTAQVKVRQGAQIKVAAKTVGDVPFELEIAGEPSDDLWMVFTVNNGADSVRHCTAFAVESITIKPIGGGRGKKLSAKDGQPAPCPERLGSFTFSHPPRLGGAPDSPRLFFDGSDPGAMTDLAARKTAPETAGFFASARGTVDGGIAGLGGASDDTRARIAKAAALMAVLGEVPSGGSGYTSYRDVATDALIGMSDRTPLDSVDKFISPPPNLLTVLQDCGRLQSMVEAYDMLRGSSVAPATDAALRDLIASWADAFTQDWNLIGDTFGLFAGHRDNWGIKAGSALITAALGLPEHPRATAWAAMGYLFLVESFERVGLDPGWYAESPHYVNYSLNNLASTAWQVRNAGSTDWFDDLEPIVDVALSARQPDGSAIPFEDGLPADFPHDVLAAAYPARTPELVWAWENSSKDSTNYNNQHLASVTRFLTVATGVAAAEPAAPPTGFFAGTSNLIVLRSGWDAAALQITSLTAVDHSDDETFTSRHNTENPFDTVLFAEGATLVPTSSGGPTVTTSTNRTYYIEPTSKNVPLVNGAAPYVTDPARITLSDRVDSRDAEGLTHRFVDLASTQVTDYAPGVNVRRTVAMVGESYAAIVDRFDGDSTNDYALTWRGRGEADGCSHAPAHQTCEWAWPNITSATARLIVDTTSDAALSGVLDSGFYAPAWATEESVAPLVVDATAEDARMLTLLRPRPEGLPPATVSPIGGGNAVGFTVAQGTVTDVIAAAVGASPFLIAGVTSDAETVVVRYEAGVPTAMAMTAGTSVDSGMGQVTASSAATISLSLTADAVVLTISEDTPGPVTLTLTDLPSFNALTVYSATFEGTPLGAPAFIQTDADFTVTLPGAGTLVIRD